MKKLTVLLMLVLSGALSVSAHAAWHTATINRIYFAADNTMNVYLNGGVHECGSTALHFLYPTLPGAKTIYAALLAWQAQNKPVQFYIRDCTGVVGNFELVENWN